LSSHVQPSPRLPGPYAAVVFDMDGLLVHTERQWLQAKVVLFERYGTELTEADRAAVFGAADLASVTYFAGRFGLPEDRIEGLRDEYIDIIGGLIDDGIEITTGAPELMAHLAAKVPLALASNTRRTLVDAILRQTPFASAFDAIATGDEVAPKPAPDVYRLACRRLGVEPAQAVAIEDSPTGVTAARAAGLTCIGVPSDADHPLPEADHVVGSLLELL
jgi:beta-phosphoglucomutase-like phosphatase (HAD superfamily)